MPTVDELYTTALWWKQIEETNNETFLPLFFDEHRYLILMGGGGSGKSIFAGRKVIERCKSEAGHRILVCRKVQNTIRQSCFNQLVGQCSDFCSDDVERIYRGDMRILFKNGSEIIFAGLDDVEKLKSIYNITGIWIEEASELEEGDFNQLDIRLRGQTAHYQQIIVSFNPISILHWLKRRFFDMDGLPAAERAKIKTHHSTYKDNRFLPEENREVLEAYKYTDSYYYSVYCLGQWGILGTSVFNSEAVSNRLLNAPEPNDIGYFDYTDYGTGIKGVKWVSNAREGFIKTYKTPLSGRHYVIGGDTAGDGSDSFVAQVLDNYTGEQVCVLRHTMDEDLYAKQVYCLGIYYNEALIGIETNWSTYPIRELQRLNYPRQYVRQTVDTYTGKTKHSYGFQTNGKTRPIIIAGLITWARDNIDSINDKTTLEEMLTFVRTEEFKPEAEAGAHDDCVMSLAIAHFIRPQQEYNDGDGTQRPWTDDMWADYLNGTEREKEMMIKKWGQPR